MRFRIKKVWQSQELLDNAFKTVRKQTPSFSKKIRKKERWAKEIEKSKVEGVAGLLEEKLKGIAKSFPRFSDLPAFYRELADATIGLEETKKQLAKTKKSVQIIQRIRRETIQKIFKSKKVASIRKLSQSFYGRTASVIKKMDKDLKALEQKRKQLIALPTIETNCFTVVLAGFPNVGKTTLLKSITQSAPRIASFPFTTKGLKIGYFEEKFFCIQLIDTPGLLNRATEKRNAIEKKAVAALKHLGEMILFVVDPSLNSGFSLEKQLRLWQETSCQFKNKKRLVVITKSDLCSAEQLQEAKEMFPQAILNSKLAEIKRLLLQEAQKEFKKH